jgi:alpha-beta hydrolase superfamily lysophospholipase
MKKVTSKTIVLIHGAFVNNETWNYWKAYYTNLGFNVIAPPWPYKDASADELRRRHPDPDVASLRLQQLIDHYTAIINELPEKPILIGHSMGGLIIQVLLNKGLAAAGIAIHSVPSLGVIPLEFSFYRAGWNSLGVFTPTNKTYLMSLKDWQYAFTNGMTIKEQQDSYNKYAVPESKFIARDALTSAAKIDYDKPHEPLLFIASKADNIIPASLNYRNFKRYRNNQSVTDYKEFEGRNHYVLGLPTWKEEADYILDWLNAFGEEKGNVKVLPMNQVSETGVL